MNLLKLTAAAFHLITDEVLRQVPEIATVRVGIVYIFIQHTSASLTVNENADPTVREDFETCFNRLVPDGDPGYRHLDEGPDDLPAHVKSSLLGANVTLPIANGRLNVGIWQGIYLCEHRNHGGERNLVVTISGDDQ